MRLVAQSGAARVMFADTESTLVLDAGGGRLAQFSMLENTWCPNWSLISADTLEICNTEIHAVKDLHVVEWLLCSGQYKHIRCTQCKHQATRDFERAVDRAVQRSGTSWDIDL